MPLQKILFKPGVNRENTRYTTEGGWYECDKIRFRQGTPESLGGWAPVSLNTFTGLCRSLWNWVTLAGRNLMGVGTSQRFYVENGGAYYDITPVRATATLTNPFTATDGSAVLSVAHVAHGARTGDTVMFSGAGITGLGGVVTASVLKGPFEVTVTSVDAYTVLLPVTANATDAAGAPEGGTVVAQYLLARGADTVTVSTGWGSGAWGAGTWGSGGTTSSTMRLWNQQNFGEDLLFGVRGGAIYYWDATFGLSGVECSITIATPAVITLPIAALENTVVRLETTGALPTGLAVGVDYYLVNVSGVTANLAAAPDGTPIDTTGSQSGTHKVSGRGVPLDSLFGASDVPLYHNHLLVSDASRFVFAFGTNELGTTTLDPMLIRWSNQEDAAQWTPAITNQAGYIRLSQGSRIVTAMQTRQEILVWSDSALYSIQSVGVPYVWGQQLLDSNISIMSPRAMTTAAGITFWMGVDKFYRYDGRVQPIRCDLRQFVFGDINRAQDEQVFAGTNEGFNEVWWFYCSGTSTTVDRYVVYNYSEDVWYYGTMARTAWIDSGLRSNPVAATYSRTLVNQETGLNDDEAGSPQPIESYITSSEFDLGDGHNLGFIWRVLPDMTFRGSTTSNPTATIYLYPLDNSGAGYSDPASYGGTNTASVTRSVAVPVEQYTGQVYTRVRGRQMAFKVHAEQLDTAWQLGAPRIDVRPDGRK